MKGEREENNKRNNKKRKEEDERGIHQEMGREVKTSVRQELKYQGKKTSNLGVKEGILILIREEVRESNSCFEFLLLSSSS